MANQNIAFLFKAASSLINTGNDQTQSKLRSHYLMRCMQLTKGFGLPEKEFSSKVRCPKCSIEWNKETVTKISPLNLSKRQRRRIKSLKAVNDKDINSKDLLHSNQLEQICSFCKSSTKTPILKPSKEGFKVSLTEENMMKKDKDIKVNNKALKVPAPNKKSDPSIYYNAKEVFTLNNQKNSLASPNIPKVIKNNKKKKDKFAGLCQQAVLASAKLKESKEKNKLLTFLKKTS